MLSREDNELLCRIGPNGPPKPLELLRIGLERASQAGRP
jgi:hypothetical protein